MTEWFFIVGINVCKESGFQPTKKMVPKFLLSLKKDLSLKSRAVLFKLCKENPWVQSKILDVSYSIEFRFETKIGCFVTKLCIFAYSSSPTYFLNLQWHHIYCGKDPTFTYQVIFFISMMLMNVFVCSYSFVNISVINVHFYCLIFCFKFYSPTVDIIINHFTSYFSVRVKPIQKVETKTKKTHSDIILA